MTIVFELNDLIHYDTTMKYIAVDKDIFNDFVENAYINVRFADDDYNVIYTYKMTEEDEVAIYMELMD